MSRLRIGIVGFDHPHVLRYAPGLAAHPDVSVEWIAEDGVNREPARKMAGRIGARWIPAPPDAKPGVDAVYLANRPGRHREAVGRMADLGLHILCDKPIALTLEDARAICGTAAKENVQLMVPFNPRRQLGPMAIKERIDSGEFGEIHMVHAIKCGKPPLAIRDMDLSWFVDPKEAGFGGFGDIGIHAVDAMRWWIGGRAKRIFAQIHNAVGPKLDVDTLGAATIEWDTGAVSTLTAGWCNPDGFPTHLDARFEVVGSRMAASTDHPYADFRLSDNQKTETVATWRPDIDGLIDAFVSSVLGGTPVPITGEDATAALEIVLAAYESSRTGTPVLLKEHP